MPPLNMSPRLGLPGTHKRSFIAPGHFYFKNHKTSKVLVMTFSRSDQWDGSLIYKRWAQDHVDSWHFPFPFLGHEYESGR